MPSVTSLWSLFKDAVGDWVADKAPSMGAALAYYTAFSIAPLLIVVIAVAGLVFGRDAAQAALLAQLQDLLGEGGGQAVESMLTASSNFGTGILTTAVGVAALLLGATTAFVELQDDLDRIWKAKPRTGSGVMNLIRSRLMSLGMVLFVGFLLAVSLALSAAISAMGERMFSEMEIVLQLVNFVAFFAVITVLFAMIYKILPNADIDWEDVWIGAAITALLFSVGKLLIGLYIGKSSVASSFGAAGPFVVLMLWVYYSTQIFLLGAEFTCVYARRHEPKDSTQPSDGAVDTRTDGEVLPIHASAPAPETGLRSSMDRAPRRPEPGRVGNWSRRAITTSAVGLAAGLLMTRNLQSRLRKPKQ